MRQKPICNICYKQFTRKANLLRHMEDIHKIFQNTFRKSSAGPQTQTQTQSPDFNTVGIETNIYDSIDKQTPVTPLERAWFRIGQAQRLAIEYARSLNALRENNYLRGQIDYSQREIRDLRERNCILPYTTFEGLSGYLCRRCLTFDFIYIQHIGYDKTMYSRHRCDEKRVITPKNISTMNLPDLSKTWDQYNSAARQMLDRLNFVIPGKKYLVAIDQSSLFTFLESLMHPDVVKILLGIPDRFYFHTVTKELMSGWINKVVANTGNKTSVEDFEIMDFLRRVNSTFAIFEIPTDTSPRRILIKITR
jgi:hypothetical protein